MASEKSYSTEIAIVVAGAIVGAGLFFGLRGREQPPPAPALVAANPPATPVNPLPGTVAVTAAQPAPPPPAAGSDRATVTAVAMKELEKYRSQVVKKCVEPALAKQPNPPQIKLTFNVSFDAQGQQIVRGVSEDRETLRQGVAMCAMDALPALSIPPPGGPVQVDLPWTLP